MHKLLKEIRQCTICKEKLPLDPRPILNFSAKSKILIVGQAPGIKAHESNTPWNDASGERLRTWLSVSKEQFYNKDLFAIVPMGFCYPGKGKSGDLPPRPECSKAWMNLILAQLKNIELTVLVGTYAQTYFLGSDQDLTENVSSWAKVLPIYFPLPHPSPRNNIWIKKNPWFEKKVLPELKTKVSNILNEQTKIFQ